MNRPLDGGQWRRVVLHIAGIHAIGSLGAVRYLAEQLPDLYAAPGGAPVSMAIRGLRTYSSPCWARPRHLISSRRSNALGSAQVTQPNHGSCQSRVG